MITKTPGPNDIVIHKPGFDFWGWVGTHPAVIGKVLAYVLVTAVLISIGRNLSKPVLVFLVLIGLVATGIVTWNVK